MRSDPLRGLPLEEALRHWDDPTGLQECDSYTAVREDGAPFDELRQTAGTGTDERSPSEAAA